MRIFFKFLVVLLLFLPYRIGAQDLSPKFSSYETRNGTLVIGRSTGIPGMFGRFTVLLNGKVLGMLGEKQIITEKLSSGSYTLTIRDDVEYRQFAGTTVRFSINSSQQKRFLVISEQRPFETRYRIVVKEVSQEAKD